MASLIREYCQNLRYSKTQNCRKTQVSLVTHYQICVKLQRCLSANKSRITLKLNKLRSKIKIKQKKSKCKVNQSIMLSESMLSCYMISISQLRVQRVAILVIILSHLLESYTKSGVRLVLAGATKGHLVEFLHLYHKQEPLYLKFFFKTSISLFQANKKTQFYNRRIRDLLHNFLQLKI